ncbi:MAG: LPS export ABC transporter periplasmic protein LptC, partial [Candidatus Gastranaerophilales bacterium]|nr:LPS export ABC transporter periplasmic protein LptC [Candidatus Gastranaerophilales bacterium]
FMITKDIRKEVSETNAKSQVATVKNLILTETKEENIYWELYAEKGSYDSKAGNVILENAMGNFYNSENEVVLSFKSNLGTYNEQTKAIVLRGDALIVAHDGSSIKSDEIVYNNKREDITARGNVVVNRNQELISTADSAHFDRELTFFEISGNTKTNIFSKNGTDTQKLVNQAEEQ